MHTHTDTRSHTFAMLDVFNIQKVSRTDLYAASMPSSLNTIHLSDLTARYQASQRFSTFPNENAKCKTTDRFKLPSFIN